MKDLIVLTHFKSIWQKERSTTRGYFLAGRAMLWFPVSIYTPTSGVFWYILEIFLWFIIP